MIDDDDYKIAIIEENFNSIEDQQKSNDDHVYDDGDDEFVDDDNINFNYNNQNQNQQKTSRSNKNCSQIFANSPQSLCFNHRTSLLSSHDQANLFGQNGLDSNNGEDIDDLNIVNIDHTDSLPNKMAFTYFDVMALTFSVVSYLFDIVTDCTLATVHYMNSNYWYFALTVAFVAFPSLIMTSINLRWYVVDSRESGIPKVSKWRWAGRIMCLVLLFGPTMRYIEAILFGLMFRRLQQKHGLRSHLTRKHFQYMIYEDADATMLRLFECFLESAPQLVLQIYILTVDDQLGRQRWPSRQHHHGTDNWTG